MVSSPMYDRVMTFAAQAEHNAELHSWDSEHKRVIDGFDQAIERVQHFQQHQGFTGKTGEALKAWADQTVARLEAKRSYYMGGIARYVAARQAIAQAAADARRLSPTLIDSKTAAMRNAAKVVLPYTPAIGVVTGGLPDWLQTPCCRRDRLMLTLWRHRRMPCARRLRPRFLSA